MKHSCILSHFKTLHATRLIWVVSVLLSACSTQQPNIAGLKEVKPNIVAHEPSAELRAEFDAAMAAIKSDDSEKGIELLNKVITTSKDYAIPYINLAIAYKKIGKLKEAEENLKQALKAEPENPVGQNEYALLYRKTGRFAEARQLYEKTLEKYPGFVIAHKNLGILCDLYTKDYACAVKHYVIYSNVMQDDKAVKLWIAEAQKRIGK